MPLNTDERLSHLTDLFADLPGSGPNLPRV